MAKIDYSEDDTVLYLKCAFNRKHIRYGQFYTSCVDPVLVIDLTSGSYFTLVEAKD